jgi:alkanesulfonate monooxygenase SsuD/methylene tetrahydromethanopterin reductase-like flavin-dependent oxidoreductase (luciferase family)
VRERIPVMLAALGPKNVELAAEIAEAWEPIFFVPGEGGVGVGRLARRRQGQARRRRWASLQVITGVPVAIGDDVERSPDFVRPALALYIGGMGARGKNFYNDLAVRYGYEAEAKTIQDLYLDGKKDEGRGGGADRAGQGVVADRAGVLRPPRRIRRVRRGGGSAT